MSLHGTNQHTAQQILEQQFGLRRIRHEAHKKKRNPGDSASPYAFWDGTLTYRTTEAVVDETEIAKTFEVMLLYGHLITFGKAFQMDGVTFSWGTDTREDPDIGTVYEDYTVVTVKYTANITSLRNAEAEARLDTLGLSSAGRYEGLEGSE